MQKGRSLIKKKGFLVTSADEKLPASETTLTYAVSWETALKLLFLLRNATVPGRQETS